MQVSEYLNSQCIDFEASECPGSATPILATPAAAAPVVATCWQVAGGVAGFAAVVGGAVAVYTATKG